MATLVSVPLRQVADAATKGSDYSSAVLSGLVPDRAHLSSGGYHCSVEDLRKHGNGRDYSNSRPDDRDFNARYGAAYDVSMSRTDMIKCYKRVYRIWKDKSDPRRQYVNCMNVWSGSGDPVRLDFVTGKASKANRTHTWHIHGEFRRRHLLSAKAARAHISMLRGETKAAWIAREQADRPVITVPPAKTTAKPAIRHSPGSRTLQYVPGSPVLIGDDVAYVQRFIGERAGTPDGKFGARTKAAVIWYQRMRSLDKADGKVGAATWRAMGIKTHL